MKFHFTMLDLCYLDFSCMMKCIVPLIISWKNLLVHRRQNINKPKNEEYYLLFRMKSCQNHFDLK